MKPKPTLSMHSATAPGSRSMRAPRASSTSAEPHLPVAERLPCFATTQPAPAATNAAVVETLKVGRPPPVPAVSSMSSRLTSTRTASSRIVRARPTSSSTVSPLVRSAIRKAAVWGSEASPDMTSRSTAAASSEERSKPDATRSIASVRIWLGKEVLQELFALAGEHRLGVKLQALRGQLAVADAHDRLAVVRRALEAGRQVGIDDQRVVAAGQERRVDAAEDRPPVVLDLRALAVDGIPEDDSAAERLRERLVTEANPQPRHARLGERADRLHRDPRLVGRARPGRDDDAVGLARAHPVDGLHVVANHIDLRPQLAQVLNEVVGERVVVVDQQDCRLSAVGCRLGHAQSPCLHASSTAAHTEPAFASVSRTS